MASEIERRPYRSSSTSSFPLQRRTQRALANLEHQTTVRSAGAQAEGFVQTVKLQESQALTREAMTGHALLSSYRDVLSGSDPLLADELRFFTDTARLAAGEIIADLVSDYCRESRR